MKIKDRIFKIKTFKNMNFFIFLLFQWSLMTFVSSQLYGWPDDNFGLTVVDSFSIEDSFTDSSVDSSEAFLVATTKKQEVMIINIDSSYSAAPKFALLYQFKSEFSPFLIRALNDHHFILCYNENTEQQQQIFEIYQITNSSARPICSLKLDRSDIRDIVVSQDKKVVYGVDYNTSLFILNVSNTNEIVWLYGNVTSYFNTLKNTDHIILSSDEKFVFFTSSIGVQKANIQNPKNVTYDAITFFYTQITYYGPATNIAVSPTHILTAVFCHFLTFYMAQLNYVTMRDYMEDQITDPDYYNNIATCQPGNKQILKKFFNTTNYFRSTISTTRLVMGEDMDWIGTYVFNLGSPSSNIHMLSSKYIIQENGNLGIFQIWAMATIVQPKSILGTVNSTLFSEEDSIAQIKNSTLSARMFFSAIFPINSNTLFLGFNPGCGWTMQLLNYAIKTSSNDLQVNLDFMIDINELILTSQNIKLSVGFGTVTAIPDNSGKYFFTYVYDGSNYWLYCYDAKQTNSFNLLASFYLDYETPSSRVVTQIFLLQLGQIIYWIPDGNSHFGCIQGLNISNITEAKVMSSDMKVIPGTAKSAIAGCVQGSNSFIFYKIDSESNLYVTIVNPTQFWNLTKISSYFISDTITTMTATANCDTLYTGGNSLRTFDITDPYHIKLISRSFIPAILTITIIPFDMMCINAAQATYVYNIKDHHFPVQVSKSEYPTAGSLGVTGYVTDTKNNAVYVFRSRSRETDGSHDFYWPYQQYIEYVKIAKTPEIFYISTITNPNLYVGKSTTYNIQVFSVGDHPADRGVYLMNAPENTLTYTLSLMDGNFQISNLPTWLLFDKIYKTITVTPPKEYENQEVLLYFDGFFHYKTLNQTYAQPINLPKVLPSLSISLDDFLNKLQLSSPSLGTLGLIIQINPATIIIITDPFSGVFVNYNSKTGVFVGNGNVASLNDMLSHLRYACTMSKTECQSIFNITVSDSINSDKNISGQNITCFNKNNPPQITLPIMKQITSALALKNNTITPKTNFQLLISSKSYLDLDGDQLSYSMSGQNATNLSSWLTFDSKSLLLSGIPSLSDEGNATFTMSVSDGFNYILDTFSILIFDKVPYFKFSLSSQIRKNTIGVGEDFYFQFTSFLDDDGPDSLTYSAETRDLQDNNITEIGINTRY